MNNQIIIEPRFCGPPDSGNGGYTCGRLASFVEGPAEVTLLKPPPLAKPLTVIRADNRVLLLDGETTVAQAAPAVVDIEIPAPPTPAQADKSAIIHSMVDDHFFPSCFVCGTGRKPTDGLCIFPGVVEGKGYVATSWTPDVSFADCDGLVRNEIIWAALDCPGAWAIIAEQMRVIVLGKLAVQILHRIKVNEKCIVLGWKIAEDGRKIMVGTALFSESGELYACAKATWIEVKPKQL
ncbi:MAG: hypothetical protein ACM3PP_09195 [Candidatus Saccharibacteria bacterium]